MLENAIIVDSITREYGSVAVVDNLSFKVKKGTIHGFLGPNGAGKTTTMKIIAGVLPATSGEVQVLGKNVQQNLKSVKRNLGVLLENPPLYKDMEVKEYLEFVARLHHVPNAKVNEYVDTAINKLNLESVRDRLIGNLSKGFKQRVGVAQAVVHKPEIVILDEPTVGLDPNAVIEMRDLITNLKENHTVLLSSHLLHEVGLICDDVTIIAKGKLQITGAMKDIAENIIEQDIIHLKVKRHNENFMSSLKENDFVQKVEFSIADDQTSYEIKIESNEDKREFISKMAFDFDLGLLEMTQEKFSLEKIFLKVTGELK